MLQTFLRALLTVAALLLPASVVAQSSGQEGSGSSALQGFSLSLPNGVPDKVFAGSRSKEVLAAQVMLDRSRHSPGVIDGYSGGNTNRAIRSYRKAHDLPAGEALDEALMRSLLEAQSDDVFRSYTITQDDAEGPFYKAASGMAAMAKMERVGFTSTAEMLANRFHMDQSFLEALNPEADFAKAGTTIHVVAAGEGQIDGEIAKIEIRKGEGSLVALDAEGKVLASYPATIGSDQFPSPSGTMEVVAVAPEANYTFTPEGREWGPDEALTIPPGPNNPVGGIWIDLSKEGYGIHGSPDPQLIGKTASHGCVRLTNWDAQALASAVKQGVTVEFV